MSIPKWREFEELVAKVQKSLAHNAVVTQNDHIVGKITGVSRQVDISIRQRIGQYEMLIVIDCKDLAEPVDVKGVEEVIGLIKDVGAHHGVIVSANGFTSTALTRGKHAGLHLYRLVDCGDHDWKTNTTIPILHDYRRIESCFFQISATWKEKNPGVEPGSFGDFESLVIYNDQTEPLGLLTDLIKPQGLFADLVSKRWNESQLPIEPGRHACIADNTVKLKSNGLFFDVAILAVIDIKKELYLGYIPIDVSGFQDELEGIVSCSSFSMSVSPPGTTWQKIEDEKQLAVKPVSTYRACVYYPLSTETEAEHHNIFKELWIDFIGFRLGICTEEQLDKYTNRNES